MKVRFFTQPYLIKLYDLGLVKGLAFATRAYNIDYNTSNMNATIIIRDLWGKKRTY